MEEQEKIEGEGEIGILPEPSLDLVACPFRWDGSHFGPDEDYFQALWSLKMVEHPVEPEDEEIVVCLMVMKVKTNGESDNHGMT